MLKKKEVTKSKTQAVKKAEAITKAKPYTTITKAHIVTKAKTKTFTAVTKARSHKSLYSRYKSSPITKPRVSTTMLRILRHPRVHRSYVFWVMRTLSFFTNGHR